MAKFITTAVLWFVVALAVWGTSKGGDSLWDLSRLGQLGDAMAPVTLLAVAWSLKLAVDERRDAQKDRDAAKREREAAVEKGEEQLGAVLSLARAQQDAVELEVLRALLGELGATGRALERHRTRIRHPGNDREAMLQTRVIGFKPDGSDGMPDLVQRLDASIDALGEACGELEAARSRLTRETEDERRARQERMSDEFSVRLDVAREVLGELDELADKHRL